MRKPFNLYRLSADFTAIGAAVMIATSFSTGNWQAATWAFLAAIYARLYSDEMTNRSNK